VCITWSRVTWKGELAVTTSMADGGAQEDGGTAAHAQGRSVALNRRAGRAGLSLEVMGRCGGPDRGRRHARQAARAGVRHTRTAMRRVACGTSRRLGVLPTSGVRASGRRGWARTPRWRGTGAARAGTQSALKRATSRSGVDSIRCAPV
jgi:hypothetical protein